MGAPLPVADVKLPSPDQYIASLASEDELVAELQTAPDFVASPHVDIKDFVSKTLSCPQTVETVLSPVPTATSSRQDSGAKLPIAEDNMVDLRTQPEEPPVLPKSSAEVLTPLNVSGRGPVLVSAFTNVAIDEICARLLTMPGFAWDGDQKPLHTIVRIGGNSKKVDPRVEKARLDWHLKFDEKYQTEVAKVTGDISPANLLAQSAKAVVDAMVPLCAQVQQKAYNVVKQKLANLHHTARAHITDEDEQEMLATEPIPIKVTEALAKRMEELHLEPIEDTLSVRRIMLIAYTAGELVKKYRAESLRLNWMLRAARMQAEQRALAAASVVVGTCMGVGSSYLDKCRFSLVVVDECSQVPELACLLPISKLAPCDPQDLTGDINTSSAAWEWILGHPQFQQPNVLAEFGFAPSKRSAASYSRVVLVGDQCQLPPTVESELMKLSGVHVSLFERLMSSTPHAATSLFFSKPLVTNNAQVLLPSQPRLAPRTVLLHTQYRMNPALASWISSKVYSNRITSGTHALHRKSPPGFPWPVAIAHKADQQGTSVFETDPATDPLARAVVSQMLAFEDLVRQKVPNATASRFAKELLAAARANAAVIKSLKGWVPHQSLDAAKSRKDLMGGDNTEEALFNVEQEAAFNIEQELASYIAQRMDGEGSGIHRGMQVRYATGSGASLVRRFPIVFIDTPYMENTVGASKSNTYEAELAVHIAASLIGALPTMQEALKPQLEKMFQTAANAVSQSANGAAPQAENQVDGLSDELASLSLQVDAKATDHNSDDLNCLHDFVTRTWLTDAVEREQGRRVTASEVGIVTPYVGQVHEVTHSKNSLANLVHKNRRAVKELERVEVKTIDGFQGREKDVIIMSCVRSNTYDSVGFLADLRRLNVAVSRAKRGLVLIGNVKTLCSHPLWASYIGEIEKAGAVVPYARLKPWLQAGVAFPDFL